MIKKVCSHCHQEKPIESFYINNATPDKHASWCKDCCFTYNRVRDNSPERKAYAARWQRSERGREFNRLKQANNKIRYTAKDKVNTALKNRTLIKYPCVVCGTSNSQGHHTDYSKPLEIVWLCPLHHTEEHRRLREFKKLSIGGSPAPLD